MSGTTGLITNRAVTVTKNANVQRTRTVFLYDQFTERAFDERRKSGFDSAVGGDHEAPKHTTPSRA
ncbi:hypothetical protein C486_08250 [Natrinema gari JCM 14663]|uniref:Uncharacterized protein n=1 Tax=Natrinema gari JCM 14663 TaxID=1230459 RepID=L9Z3E6_9EURY|nr:hypothetical protein C486_08250 [Natrinema gari JCM 14663]